MLDGLRSSALGWIKGHLALVLAIVFFILGAAVRISLRGNISGDAAGFLIPWYDQIEASGGLAALSSQVGNYGIPYQFFIALSTYLPLPALYAYKAFSILFDLLLAISSGLLARSLARRDEVGVLAFACVWIAPTVMLNSAAWAQCDSIYGTFCILALLFLIRRNYPLSFTMLGLAFAFKLQAVFLLPFFIYWYIKNEQPSLLFFLIIPAVMVVASLPGIVAGRSMLDVFAIYMQQSVEYPSMFLNYPSFWVLPFGSNNGGAYALASKLAIALTVAILMLLMYAALKSKKGALSSSDSHYSSVLFALVMCFACVLFLPAMHERYGYVYEVLAIVVACVDKRTILLAALLQALSLLTYCSYLFAATVDLPAAAILNIVVFACYVALYFVPNKSNPPALAAAPEDEPCQEAAPSEDPVD